MAGFKRWKNFLTVSRDQIFKFSPSSSYVVKDSMPATLFIQNILKKGLQEQIWTLN